MARFAIGQSLTTTTPTIVVDAGLPVGQHRFQLIVIDAQGNRSVPATALVAVRQIVIDPGPVGPGPVGPLPGPIDPAGPSPGPVIPIPTPLPDPGPVIRPTPVVVDPGPVIPPRPDPVIRPTPVVTPREAEKPKRKPRRKEPK